ncbi:hypothetical protein M885DRAFT_220508 [Pelagophyceae sp. CCMP2097]|nr:hypothetical protein M885DRAFT_220508 [Pelagophyceae sp. CCMP2097]
MAATIVRGGLVFDASRSPRTRPRRMARALRRAAVLVVLRCAAALQPLQGAALAIPGLDRGGRIRTIADVEFRSLFREFKVGDCVPANAAVDGWTVVLYPKGRSNAAGERGRVCVAVRRPNEDQGGQEGDRGVACVDASVTVRLCGAQAEGRRFDVESQGGARFVPRGARADRGSGRVEECGLSLLQADLCKGFVDEAGVMRAKITIETFDAVSIDALGYDALGSDAGLALSPPRRALSRLDARRTRDGVHLGTHVVPLWANLEERAKLGETGCYGGVDFVVERIVDASGCDVFSVVPGGGDVLYMRPVYPLVARLEREWPVSVPEKDLGLLLRPAAYAAVQLGTTLSAALATLATAVLVSTFLVSVSVVPSRSMEPYILPGDVLLVEKASSAVLRREPLRGEVVLFAPPIALRRIVQETSCVP